MSIVAIDVGGTRIKLGLFDGDNLAHVEALPVRRDETFAQMLGAVRDAATNVLQKLNLSRCDGFSISFPGFVDRERGRVLKTFGKFDDAREFELPAWIRAHRDVPFVIDNDAHLALFGEWQHGAGRGVDNLVMVTLGTGIGTSALMDGRIVQGKHFQAGNIGGHSVVEINGRRCTMCGNRGCLEAEASTWALPEILHEKMRPSPFLDEPVRDYAAVFKWAQRGDALATQVAERSVKVWATGIVNLIHAFDPERVVIGGGIMRSADYILPRIREHVHERALTPWGKVEVVCAEHLDSAALWGGYFCLMQKA